MDPAGDFTVVWSSFVQDGSGYGVYARHYNAATAVLGPEFRVNENAAESNGLYTTNYWQYQPAVAMSADGKTVITWSTDGQRADAHDIDIHARIYDSGISAAGVPLDFMNSATGLPWGEFRINANILSDQIDSRVAMDSVGNFVTVWVGPDLTNAVITANVFDRIVDIGAAASADNHGRMRRGGRLERRLVLGPAPAVASTSQMLVGTAGNDVLNLTLGPTPSGWGVRLNGASQAIGGGVALLGFDGNGGSTR